MGLQQIYQTRCLSKAMKIVSDNRHPLYEFELLPSSRRFGISVFFRNSGKIFYITGSEVFKWKLGGRSTVNIYVVLSLWEPHIETSHWNKISPRGWIKLLTKLTNMVFCPRYKLSTLSLAPHVLYAYATLVRVIGES